MTKEKGKARKKENKKRMHEKEGEESAREATAITEFRRRGMKSPDGDLARDASSFPRAATRRGGGNKGE